MPALFSKAGPDNSLLFSSLLTRESGGHKYDPPHATACINTSRPRPPFLQGPGQGVGKRIPRHLDHADPGGSYSSKNRSTILRSITCSRQSDSFSFFFSFVCLFCFGSVVQEGVEPRTTRAPRFRLPGTFSRPYHINMAKAGCDVLLSLGYFDLLGEECSREGTPLSLKARRSLLGMSPSTPTHLVPQHSV